MATNRQKVILVADDDPDDRMLITDAWEEAGLPRDILHFVEDGEQLMDFLYSRGRFSPPENKPKPDLILLDLNMPRMDGREALSCIKSDTNLKRIPVIVLSTSKADDDILGLYNQGISGFITKPVSFDGLIKVVESIKSYWLDTLHLPPHEDD